MESQACEIYCGTKSGIYLFQTAVILLARGHDIISHYAAQTFT